MPQLFFRFKVRRQHSLAYIAESQASQLQTYCRKTEFNAKWSFKFTQRHVLWSQWKGDKGLSNTKY